MQLVGLVVVRNVKVIDIFLGLLNSRLLLFFGDLRAACNVRISSFAPFPGGVPKLAS